MKYVEVRKNEVLITIGDSFHLEAQDEVEEEIKEAFLIDTVDKFIVDMRKTEYMDSSALGILVDIKSKLEGRGGTLILRGVHGRCREVFENTFLVNEFIFE